MAEYILLSLRNFMHGIIYFIVTALSYVMTQYILLSLRNFMQCHNVFYCHCMILCNGTMQCSAIHNFIQ